MESQKNIKWINVMRALCIVGVYFVHCQYVNDTSWSSINKYIYTFYVNGFFFVSGYLLFWKQLSHPKIDEDRKTYISKNGGGKLLLGNILFRIVIPSILFSIIEFFPSALIQGHNISVEYGLYKTIGGGTYWFTSALAIAELVLLVAFCSRVATLWFYVILSFVFALIARMCFEINIGHEIWAWNRGLMSLAILSLGGLYWKYEKHIDRLLRWWIIVPLIVLYYIIVNGFLGNSDPIISIRTIQPLGCVSSAISCLLIVKLCKWLPDIKFLSFVGKNSLGYYFMSGALPIVCGIVLRKVLDINVIWIILICFLISLIFAGLIILLINKYMPWLWDMRKIKRKDLIIN